ncbi:hypothetical protein [Pseudomonas sp. dw_358]|uniref:hypothetical protein n=1 Tax=Pseudomonas sp. dw_358 TaxID=2720083 RepID=UPI001BD2F23D|nr:hypothetical protein [Pseudomonas sp. dw_358]
MSQNFSGDNRFFEKIFRWGKRLAVRLILWFGGLWVALWMAWIALGIWAAYFQFPTPPAPRAQMFKDTTTICGRIQGKAFTVPASYVVLWPHYDKVGPEGLPENRKACERNIQSLSLAFKWPELHPGQQEYIREFSKFSGLLIRISSAPAYTFSDLENRLTESLAASNEQKIEYAGFEPMLDLYKVTEKTDFSELGTTTFWGGRRDRADVIFICPRNRPASEIEFCTGLLSVPEVGGLVEIHVSPGKLAEWKTLINTVRWIIREGLKTEPSWPIS